MDKINKDVIKLAYNEDVKTGDVTSEATINPRTRGKAMVIAKSNGVLSGSEAFRYAMSLASPRIKVNFKIRDGKRYKTGNKIVLIEGPSQALLRGERLALNLLAHLSGVASYTAEFVAKTKGTRSKILDTRKTTPGLRTLEKQAVVHGGGQNHRQGLYDMVLIKDNHIAAAGGVAEALERTEKVRCKVEIEVADFKQLKTALEYSPDIIMLDNFTTAKIKKAVEYIKSVDKKIKIEVSGGVNLKSVRRYAETGVDYISIGALTHSVKAADFSMKYL